MSVPLPLVEVWEDLQPEVEHLTGIAGLKIIQAVIEDEISRRVGPRHHPEAASGYLRWGQQPSYVNFCGQKVRIRRPRVRIARESQIRAGLHCTGCDRQMPPASIRINQQVRFEQEE